MRTCIEIEKCCEHDECGEVHAITAMVIHGFVKFPDWTDEMMLMSPEFEKYGAHFNFRIHRHVGPDVELSVVK